MENISVTLSAGILKVSAPKKAQVTKRIPIQFQDKSEEDGKFAQLDVVKENSRGDDEG